MNSIKKGSLLVAKGTDGLSKPEEILSVYSVGHAQLLDSTQAGDLYVTIKLSDENYFAFNCTDKESSLYLWNYFYTLSEYRKIKLKKIDQL